MTLAILSRGHTINIFFLQDFFYENNFFFPLIFHDFDVDFNVADCEWLSFTFPCTHNLSY